MPEHLSKEMLRRYAERKLSPAALIEADDHLAVCAKCAEQLESVAGDKFALFAFNLTEIGCAPDDETRAPHLDFETQLMPYIEGALGAADKKLVETHLRKCPACEAETKDLQAFRAKLAVAASAAAPLRTKSKFPIFELFRQLNFAEIAFGAMFLTLFALGVFWLAGQSRESVKTAQKTSEIAAGRNQTVTPQTAPAPPSSAPENISEQALNPSSIVSDKTLSPHNATPQIAKSQSGSQAANEREVIAGKRSRNPVKDELSFELAGLSPDLRRDARRIIKTGNLSKPESLKEVTGNKIRFLAPEAAEKSFYLTTPVGTNVRSAAPEFEWQKLGGAESYTVTVFDADFNRVAKSRELTENRWTPVAELKRGETYYWQVTAIKNKSEITAPLAPLPEAKFRILSAAEEAELARAIRQAAGAPLARAVIYARAGLLDEAEAELSRQIQIGQKTAPARKLLQKVRSWRK